MSSTRKRPSVGRTLCSQRSRNSSAARGNPETAPSPANHARSLRQRGARSFCALRVSPKSSARCGTPSRRGGTPAFFLGAPFLRLTIDPHHTVRDPAWMCGLRCDLLLSGRAIDDVLRCGTGCLPRDAESPKPGAASVLRSCQHARQQSVKMLIGEREAGQLQQARTGTAPARVRILS